MRHLGLANKITILRILLVPFMVSCFLYYSPERDYLRFIALAIFFVCAITDGIDGYVARKYYQKTELGKILDPLADKLLLFTAYLSLTVLVNIPQASRIPPWLTLIVISRDALILLGSMVVFIISKRMAVEPSVLGKLSTFFQMATIVAVLLQVQFIELFWWAAAFFTIVSGLGYLWSGSKALNNEPHRI